MTRAAIDDDIFALLAPGLAGGDAQLAALAESATVPLVAVAAPSSADRPRPGRSAFFILASPDDQAVAMAQLALEGAEGGATLVIAHGPNALQRRLALDVRDRCRSAGFSSTTDVEIHDAADLDEAARGLGRASAVILLGPAGRMSALLTSVATQDKKPTILIPAALADGDVSSLPPTLDGRIVLGLPLAPSDQTPEAMAKYRTLAERAGLGTEHRPGQLATLAAAEVLVEGIRRSGRDLTRARFVAALEALRDFRTGLAPPLTFGPNRRVGTAGAHAVMVDLVGKRVAPSDRWVEAERPPG